MPEITGFLADILQGDLDFALLIVRDQVDSADIAFLEQDLGDRLLDIRWPESPQLACPAVPALRILVSISAMVSEPSCI